MELVTVLAVRERGAVNKYNIIRLLYFSASFITKMIGSWVAMERWNENDKNRMYFQLSGVISNRILEEERIGLKFVILSLGKRCTDLFTLWQFRVTCKVVDTKLLSNETTLRRFQRSATHHAKSWIDRGVGELSAIFFAIYIVGDGRLDKRIFVLKALTWKEFVSSLFECGMLGMPSNPCIDCFPDVISSIIPKLLELAHDNDDALASAEVKTNVSTLWPHWSSSQQFTFLIGERLIKAFLATLLE